MASVPYQRTIDVNGGDPDLDVLSNQTMRHAVANRVDVDERVVGDPAPNDTHVVRLDVDERLQLVALVALESHTGWLMRRAVDALVGLGHPRHEVLLERREARELPPGERVALDVLRAALDLALGPCSIRRARSGHQRPVAAELNAVFHAAPLERSDWLISVLVAAAVLPVVTLQKHATKKAAAHGAGVTPPSRPPSRTATASRG